MLISRTSDSSSPVPELEKKATPALINKSGRRTFMAGSSSNYNF